MFQLKHILSFMVKVKLMNVIKLNRNTRTDRFYIVIKKRSLVTDNVQRNISRYVQLYKYGVYNDIYNSGIFLFPFYYNLCCVG